MTALSALFQFRTDLVVAAARRFQIAADLLGDLMIEGLDNDSPRYRQALAANARAQQELFTAVRALDNTVPFGDALVPESAENVGRVLSMVKRTSNESRM